MKLTNYWNKFQSHFHQFILHLRVVCTDLYFVVFNNQIFTTIFYLVTEDSKEYNSILLPTSLVIFFWLLRQMTTFLPFELYPGHLAFQ